MTAMTREEILALADEFMDAVKTGDAERLKNIYAENVEIWHTFDGVSQNRDKNIRSLIWMHKHVKGIRYDDLRVAAVDDGFVQQHVMHATVPEFTVPCMLRAWCEDGHIVRIEEYLDSAHTVSLRDYIQKVRSQNPAEAESQS